MKRFQMKNDKAYHPKDFKNGALLLVKWNFGLRTRPGRPGPHSSEELLLKVCPKHFLSIGSSDLARSGGPEEWEWLSINSQSFSDVRILNRSDLPLCMHLTVGEEFMKLLKGGQKK